MRTGAVFLYFLLMTACSAPLERVNSLSVSEVEASESSEAGSDTTEFYPPSGSNEMLRAALSSAEGLEVIISDVVIPPNAEVPRHYHPGEEFVYVIEGSAVHVEEGKPEQIVQAGDALVIPPEAEHAPRGGPEGARAIVFRVHVEGAEERILIE